MSTPVQEVETDAELAADDAIASRHSHPSDLQYIGIAALLAVLTSIEVAVYYLKADSAIIVVLLMLMAIKFAIVVGFFMHLRFDSPVLRRLFVTGLILAGSVYTILLFILGIYHV